MDNLTKAKAVLIMDQPFFASLFLSLPLIADANVKTLSTNGDEIRYNPAFLAELTVNEIVFVLAHETMHCVFMHMYRRNGRDAGRWNIAGDYIINDILVRDRVGTMPAGCLLDHNLVKNGGETTEGVYNLIPESENGKQPGEAGAAMDEVLDAGEGEGEGAPLDASQVAAKEAEMRVKIVQAANAAKMCGKMSGGLARIVQEMTKTRVDWKSVLRRFISERAKTELSYAKPKRRFMADDINLPSLTGEKLGSIVVAVDCSGSIDEALLNQFAAEIKAIIADVSPAMTHVVYFDSSVSHMDSYSADDALDIRAHGGGGTAFSPIFKHIDDNALNPTACVVLTDLLCSDFGEAPDYPVLWASTEDRAAPFGEVVKIAHEH